MANKHLQHVKSNVVNNGSPKLPTTSQLLLGEIGINYANGYERMSIKNDANEIVEFVSKEYVVGKSEIDSIVATAVAQAVNPTGGSQTPEQKALTDAIAEAVAKAIQDAIPTGGGSQTPAQEAMTDAISAAVSQAIKDALSSTSPSSEETDLANAISDAVTKAIQDAISATTPTQEQQDLTNAISDAVTKAIQDALSAISPTQEQTDLTNAISDAVTKAIQDALSASSPTQEQEALTDAISETVTKAIQEALSATTPSAEQEALTKAISDAVAKAIQDALDPQSQDKTIVEEIDNTITNYVYTNGGTSISLTDVMTNSHTHSNKSVLDGITQEKVTSWDNASSGGVTNVAYDGTNKKITKTVGGSTTDVVSVATLKSDMNITKSDVSLDNVTNDSQVKRTEMGVANGVATLDSAGKVPSSQLPSYVDDVVEGYYYDSKFYKEAAHTTLITGESDKIYVDLSTDTTYRCSNVTNQTYTQIKGDLALGETETTAYRGDRGKIAYDHSQAAHARVDATNTEASSTNGNIKINGTETTVYTHPAFTAQTAAAKKVGMNDEGHVVLGDSLTKSDVGLDNVGNFKAVSTVASQGLTDAEKSAARDNIGAGTSSLVLGSTSTTAAAGNHTHGNIGNDGKLTDTAAAAAGNDYVVIRDADNSNIQTSNIKGVDVADAVNKKHSHSNQTVLDGITSEKVTAWDNASSGGVTNVAYDATNKKITKTVGGTTTDVVTVATLKTDLNLSKSDVGLDNVGNFKAVSTEESQGLSSTEQANARANIGAGTSSFSGSYDDLTNKIVFNTAYDATTNKAATMSDIPSVPTHGTAASGGTDLSVVTTGEMYTWNNKSNVTIGTTVGTAFDGAAGATAKAETDFLTGVNNVSSIASIPVNKRLVICTATSGTFSLASIPPAGREIHIILGAGSYEIPNTGNYVLMNDNTSMSVASGKRGEINVISDGTTGYIRYASA